MIHRSGRFSVRRSVWILGLVLIVAAGGWWLGRGAEVDRSRVYRIGFGGDVPMHFAGVDGRPSGLAVEIVREAARRQGIQLEWLNADTIDQDTMDLWVLKSLVPDLPRTLHYTEPYLQAESCFLVLAESPVRDLPDLHGGRISYLDYRIHRETLPRLLTDFRAMPVQSSREAVDVMIAGQADAAYVDQYTLFSTLLAGDQRPLRILPTRSPTRDMAIAARFPSAAVADEIRAGMQSMAEDGSLNAIMQRWIFFPNMTANIIGDLAKERQRVRRLTAGAVALSVLLGVALVLAVVAQRRKNEWRRSEQKYRELHESMTDAYVQFDLTGRIKGTNPAFCDMLGYTDEALRNRENEALTPESWHEMEAGVLRDQVLPRGHSDIYEKEFRRRDGTVLPVELRTFLLRDSIGRATGMWAIVRDITERKLAEAERERLHLQLTQSQKMEVVGRLAGGVAHDFNNMLQAILGNANLALMELPEHSPLRESLEEIRLSAQRSADLTGQLLAFARKQTIAPVVLDLNETVASTLKMLRRLIGEGVEMLWQPGARLWSVRMDPSQMDQILTNLCVNARDAVRGDGRVQLETRNVSLDPAYCATRTGFLPGDFVTLSVTDNGCGMDEQTMEHLFEPFFTTKEMGQGTGLGLATVYGIVTQNGGFISVTSAPQRGTTIRVHLPRHDEPATVAADEPAVPIRGGGETLLLVEDETPVLRIGKLMLENLGYRVLAESTPAGALRQAEAYAGRISLLITDVVMPEMNGRELARRVAVLRPHVRIIYMSGYDANVVAPHGVLEQGFQFLPKPFSLESLALKVRAVLDEE